MNSAASPHGDFVALRGTKVEIVIREAPRLRTDDCLLLDDGRVVEIVAKPEKLIEARAADVIELARLAWILGDRHIPVEVAERYLRVRHDAATEKLLRAQGARIASIEAPFEPEGGAYAPSNHGHAHGHDHVTHTPIPITVIAVSTKADCRRGHVVTVPHLCSGPRCLAWRLGLEGCGPGLARHGSRCDYTNHDRARRTQASRVIPIRSQTHVTDIVEHIDMERLTDVHLVGWSYGGMVTTGVLARMRKRVRSMIYLDAFLPENGKALADYAEGPARAAMDAAKQADKHMPPIPMKVFGVTDPVVIAFAQPRLGRPVVAVFLPAGEGAGAASERHCAYLYPVQRIRSVALRLFSRTGRQEIRISRPT